MLCHCSGSITRGKLVNPASEIRRHPTQFPSSRRLYSPTIVSAWLEPCGTKAARAALPGSVRCLCYLSRSSWVGSAGCTEGDLQLTGKSGSCYLVELARNLLEQPLQLQHRAASSLHARQPPSVEPAHRAARTFNLDLPHTVLVPTTVTTQLADLTTSRWVDWHALLERWMLPALKPA